MLIPYKLLAHPYKIKIHISKCLVYFYHYYCYHRYLFVLIVVIIIIINDRRKCRSHTSDNMDR